jgi:hypothetical protein
LFGDIVEEISLDEDDFANLDEMEHGPIHNVVSVDLAQPNRHVRSDRWLGARL